MLWRDESYKSAKAGRRVKAILPPLVFLFPTLSPLISTAEKRMTDSLQPISLILMAVKQARLERMCTAWGLNEVMGADVW